MKYILLAFFAICLFPGSGCTSVKSVPMITQEEDQRLLDLSRSRKDKNMADRITIGVQDPKDDNLREDAEQLMLYFEMTDYVKEAGYVQNLAGKPDYIVEYMEPCRSTRIPMMITIPFYILSLGIIPMYTYLDWGYNFTLRSAGDGSEIPLAAECHTYGFSGWICLLMNWIPGWRPYSISGEYKPLEADCRIILQLQDMKKDILKSVPDRQIP